MKTKLTLINNLISQKGSSLQNIGLLNGKMGVCIYLFYLARHTENQQYQVQAEALLDDIWIKVEESPQSLDFGNGLAGIAWSTEHLMQNNFVAGDINEALCDADDKIFQYLTNIKEASLDLHDGLLGYGFYLVSRLQSYRKTDQSDQFFLLRRLLAELLNQVHAVVENKEYLLREPPAFQLKWKLPLLLILLAKIKECGIYSRKVDVLIYSLEPFLLSTFGANAANRYYLMLSVKQVLAAFNLPERWAYHIRMLEQNLNIQMINQEFSEIKIEPLSGLSGVVLLESLFCGEPVVSETFCKRIIASPYWDLIKEPEKTSPVEIGLQLGLSGILLCGLLSGSRRDYMLGETDQGTAEHVH
ncbi:lanthionine synthetase LanC family protein [Fulvivirga sp. M361]|uniref:lanthionine synthetase LanC family protein n=1 Tax=Fulvivirga sp. M361 TaxID=2594266 RepID=UPI00162728FC|nr:lanthionine synthetase LanC family protein [Fulvivirga sp. M361]